jgi:hypothetical protein
MSKRRLPMKKNSNEVIVEQTVTLDDLPPLPPVTIRHGAIDVDLDQIHDGIRETVSIEFDSLQKVIDILTKMLQQKWKGPGTIVAQTVRLGNLSHLPIVRILLCAGGVSLKQFYGDMMNTVTIEFGSLQQVIDILTKMLHQHDWEDWNRLVGGDQKPGTGTPPPLP